MSVTKHIETNKHVFICGTTGTGKSFLCENYLRGYDYVIKLDTKNETEERREQGLSPWSGLQENVDFTVTYDVEELPFIETKKIIFVPPYDFSQADYNKFFYWVFLRKNTILWIDELMSFTTANSYPIELKRLYTQGRSKNIGIWACTQRPSGIPLIVPANCHYFFIFDLTWEKDRKTIVQNTGQEKMLEMPNGYNFWYYKMGDKECIKARLET